MPRRKRAKKGSKAPKRKLAKQDSKEATRTSSKEEPDEEEPTLEGLAELSVSLTRAKAWLAKNLDPVFYTKEILAATPLNNDLAKLIAEYMVSTVDLLLFKRLSRVNEYFPKGILALWIERCGLALVRKDGGLCEDVLFVLRHFSMPWPVLGLNWKGDLYAYECGGIRVTHVGNIVVCDRQELCWPTGFTKLRALTETLMKGQLQVFDAANESTEETRQDKRGDLV